MLQCLGNNFNSKMDFFTVRENNEMKHHVTASSQLAAAALESSIRPI